MDWKNYKAGDLPALEGRGAGAAGLALAWLAERHGAAVATAVDERLFDRVAGEYRRVLDGLDAATWRLVWTNTLEWLLAEGRIETADGRRPVSDCLLAADGPALDAGQRRWLEQLSRRLLRVYEVVEVTPACRMRLRDALDEAAVPVAVEDEALSWGELLGTQVAVRLMEADGHWALSGALYPFSQVHGRMAVDHLREAVEQLGEPEDATDEVAHIQSLLIRHHWLAQCVDPDPAPQRRGCSCDRPKGRD